MAERLKPDSGTRGGGKCLSNDALGTLVPGHAPRLAVKADLRVLFFKDVCLTAVGAMSVAFTGPGAQLQGGRDLNVGENAGRTGTRWW
jgi:hypothetical protein